MNAGLKQAVFIVASVAAIAAPAVFAQSITVSKDAGDAAMFSTVQAAVNAAKPGDVIEILDAGVYEEQVTIDGREKSPWTGIAGGKNGITIRSKNPTGLAKPVIKYRDTKNTSPRSIAEAGVSGELVGQSGNFETCAALRVLWARNITVEGIIIDGGSPFVFGAVAVWGGKDALFHGNAAVTSVVSGGTQIRNCEFRNAYFGVYVKDRNIGGVFANPNKNDNDVTIPLSGFGRAGNHLFEYNRVHDNAVGFYFESSWDLGSTVRYNLIYNNYYTAATKSAITAAFGSSSTVTQDQMPGAFLFKDNYLSPIAIYNNTLHNNFANLVGHWQIGGQHLVFNNIFGQQSGANTGGSASYMLIDHKFPNRMKHCVFSVADRQRVQVLSISGLCADNPNNPYTPGNSVIADIGSSSYSFSATKTSVTLNLCSGTMGTVNTQIVLPGAIITGAMGTTATIPADANIRWLEMAGGTLTGGTATSSGITLPSLFQSTDTASPNFLEPVWNDPLVISYIKNKGWPESGIRNPDGNIADLGAIPSSSARRQSVTARIRPTDVVRVSGTSAAIGFYLDVEGGEMNNPKIKYLKWIYQIPDNGGGGTSSSFGSNFDAVPATSVRAVTPPTAALKSNGGNSLTVAIPAATTAANQYGFFELTVEGTDAAGKTVSSDVGFLPYRPLDYSLKMEVLKDGAAVTKVAVGEVVTLRVTPMKGAAPFTGALNKVDFWLNSNASQMWLNDTVPFTGVVGMTGSADYPVIFKNTGNRTGSEIIMVAGTSGTGAAVLPFFGSCELTVVDRYTLRYRADAGGSIQVGDTVQVIEKGGRGSPVAAVADEGYGFTMWSDGVTNILRTDTNVTSNKTVTAYFCGSDNIKTLSYKAGNGGGISGPVSQKVCGGSSGYPVAAAPKEGYRFVKWSDGKKEAGRTDAEVFEDAEYTAEFALKTYILVYAAGPNGSLIGGDDIMTVNHGANGGTVLAVPDDGYEFVTWSDGVKDNPRADKNVSANIAVSAVFDVLKHNVSYYVSPALGVLVGSASQRVTHGANASAVYVTGANGYTFFEWSDGSKDTVRVDKNVSTDIFVSATFKDAKGNISVASPAREIPKFDAETKAAVAPVAVTAWGEFTAGPNPAGRRSGGVSFFWHGSRVKNATLRVYDASGNFVKNISIRDNVSAGGAGKRAVGSWDLTDRKGRAVGEGTYLVKGTIESADGKKTLVLTVVGVQ